MNHLTFWAERIARFRGFPFEEDKKKDGRWVTGLFLTSFFYWLNKEQRGVER